MKRRTTREVVKEHTYPLSIYDLPELTYKCRYCGKAVTLSQLESNEAVEDELQRFESDLPQPTTYGYMYHHTKCRDAYERGQAERKRKQALERLRKEYHE